MLKKRLIIFGLVFLFFESFANIIFVSIFKEETNVGAFVDDYINFPTLDCAFEPDLTSDFTIQKTAESPLKNVASFGTPIVGDVTGDGKPEVLILQSPGNSWNANLSTGSEPIYKTRNIVVYNYDGSNLVQTATLNTPFFINMEGPNPFLIARVPGFTNPLVIVAASSSEPSSAYKSRLVAYEYSGGTFTQRWISDLTYGDNVPDGTNFPGGGGPPVAYKYSSGGAPGIADFDGDGTPEVYIFNELFDATTGAKLADGGAFGQGVSQVTKIGNYMYGGSTSVTVAADITSSPGLELAAGNTIYNVTKSAGSWTMTPINAGFNVNGSLAKDGFTSIADINRDGNLDVIVTTARQDGANSRTVYVWNVDGANNPVLIASNILPDSPLSNFTDNSFERGTGIAFIGDIDGDNDPEIGVTSHLYLTMFKYNGSPTLQVIPGYPQVTNDRSGYTLITMFDFNQDGNQELVYRDERRLRIINGNTGADLASFDVYSATAGEGAIVADLDDDGEAEIVVTDAEFFDMPTPLNPSFPANPDAYLTVYETASEPWAPAREVWNQYAYFNVNILGDLSVPQNQLNHAIRAIDLFPNLDPVDGCFEPDAQPLNSFLVQGTFYNDSGCRTANIPAFDVEIDNSSLFARRTCEEQTIEINFKIRNNFTALDIPEDMEISFYKQEADGTLTFLGEKITADRIITQGDGWVDYVGVVVSSPLIPTEGDFNLVIIANNTGTVDSPDRLLECNYNNNTSSAIPVVDLPTYSIQSSDTELCAPGNQLTLTPVTSDTLAINPEKNWRRVDLAGFSDFQIPNGVSYPVNDPDLPGTTYTIDANENLIVDNLPEGQFSFVFDFVDCTLIEEVNTFTVDVFLTPSPTFVSQDASCFQENNGSIILSGTDRESGITYQLLDENENPVAGFSEVQDALVNDTIFVNLTPGSYRVRYYNQANNSCGDVSEILTITEPSPLVLDVVSVVPTTCEIPDNGSITLGISGGTPGYQLLEVLLDGNPLPGLVPTVTAAEFLFSNVEAGTYQFQFEDANGCILTSPSIPVSTTPAPVVSIPVSDICEEGTLAVIPVLTEQGSLTDPIYTWVLNPGNIPLPNGTGSVLGGSYTVNPGVGLTPPTLELSDLPANQYSISLTVTGDGSCDRTFTEDFAVNPNPAVSFSSDPVVCYGESSGRIYLASGGAADYTYQLVGSGESNTTGEFLNMAEGDYEIVVTNQFGCTQLVAVQVEQPDPIAIADINSTNPFCGVDDGIISFTINGGIPDYLVKVNGIELIPSNFTFSQNGNLFEITNLSPGDYTVEVTDANGCDFVLSPAISLVNNEGYTVNVDMPALTICETGSAVIQPVVTADALAVPVYTWFKDSGLTTAIVSSPTPDSEGVVYTVSGPELTIEGLPENSYTYYLEVSGDNICPFVVEADVTVVPSILGEVTTVPVTCFGEASGQISVINVSGGSGQYQYSLDGVNWQNSNDFIDLAAGDYTVWIQDDTGNMGCSITLEAAIDSPAEPIQINTPDLIPASCDISNGAIRNLIVSGGWGDYTFEWRKDDPVSGELIADSSITGIEDLAPGLYYLIVSDSLSCSQVFEFPVEEASDPKYEIIPLENSCEGAPVVIQPIHLAPDPSAPKVMPTEVRWYKNSNQVGLIESGPDSENPAINYQVDDVDWLNPSLTISNLPAGTYTYYFYIECTGEEIPTTFSVYAQPEVSFETSPVSCFGGSDGKIVILDGDQEEFTYSVNGEGNYTSSELQNIGLPAGTYTILVSTLAVGCDQSIELVIDEPDHALALQLLEQTNASCGLDNGSIRLSLLGGVPTYVLTMNGEVVQGFDLDSEGSEVFFEELAAGNYEFTLTDSNNCTEVILSVPVLADEIPEFDLPESTTICENDPDSGLSNLVEISPEVINLAGATPLYTWYYVGTGGQETAIGTGDQVNGASVTILADGTLQLDGLQAQPSPYEFLLEITGDKVCPGPKLETAVIVNETPEVEIEVQNEVCFEGNSGAVSIISGHKDGYSYELSELSISNDTGEFTGLSAGDYTLVVTAPSGCPQNIPFSITQPEKLELVEMDYVDPSCGIPNGEISFEIQGGTPEYLITINSEDLQGGDFEWANTGDLWTVKDLSPGSYEVNVQDLNGCQTASISFNLVNNEGIELNLEPMEIEICEGEIAVFSPQTDLPPDVSPVYKWFKDEALTQEIESNNPPDSEGLVFETKANGVLEITGLAEGDYTYYVRVSGEGICTASFPAQVGVAPSPKVDLEVQNISCFGENDGSVMVLSGHEADYQYTLSTGETNATGTFTDLAPGNYTLEVMSSSGCSQILTFEITEPGNIELALVDSEDPTCGNPTGMIEVEVIGGTPDFTFTVNGETLESSSLDWVLNGTQLTLFNLDEGSYEIRVADANSCPSDSEINVDLVNVDGADLGLQPIEIAIDLGEIALFNPDFDTTSGLPYTFEWYLSADTQTPVPSSGNPDSNGVIYQIDGNQLSVEGLPAGTYVYYMKLSGQGICTQIVPATVVVKPPLSVTVQTSPITCANGADGTILVVVDETDIDHLQYSLDDSNYQDSPLFEDLPEGTYTVYIRDPEISEDPILSIADVILEATYAPIELDSFEVLPASCSLENGEISNLSIVGGSGNYTLTWYSGVSPDLELLQDGNNEGITGIPTGMYTLEVLDDAGCIGVFEVEVPEVPAPEFESMEPLVICEGEEALLIPVNMDPNADPSNSPYVDAIWSLGTGQSGIITSGQDPTNPGVSYELIQGEYITHLQVSGLPAGTYQYYAWIACTQTELTFSVEVQSLPEVVFETQPVSCFGTDSGKVTISSGGDVSYTYQIDGGSPLSQEAFENYSFEAGTFEIQISNTAGCTQLAELVIEGPAEALSLTLDSILDPGCGSSNGVIEGSVAGGWSAYTVELIFEGETLQTQTLSEAGSFLFSNLGIGTYSILLTDSLGCELLSEPIELVDGPTQIFLEDAEICVGEEFTLIPTLSPPATGYSLQWSFDPDGNEVIVASSSPAADGNIYEFDGAGNLLVQGLTPGEFRFYVRAVGGDVCEGFVAEAMVAVYSLPQVSVEVVHETCFDTTGKLRVQPEDNGSYTYSIDGENFQENPEFDLESGVYQVWTKSLETGCVTVSPEVEILGAGAPIEVSELVFGDATCGLSDGEASFQISGGIGPFQISLWNGESLVMEMTLEEPGNVSLSGLPAGDYDLEILDSLGCDRIFEGLIPIQGELTTIEVEDVTICVGETAVLTPLVDPNLSELGITWYFDSDGSSPITDGMNQNNVSYSILDNGNLQITGLDESMSGTPYYALASSPDICRTEMEEARVYVNALPELRVFNPSIVCDPEGFVDLTQFIIGFNPELYDYNVFSPVGKRLNIEEMSAVDFSGDYRIQSSLKGSNCWNSFQRIKVLIAEEALVAQFEYYVDLGLGNIVSNSDVSLGEDVFFKDLSSGNAVIWDWDFGDGTRATEQNPIHNYSEVGEYVVKLVTTDSIGCQSEYQVIIHVFDDYKIIIPNAFTPNGTQNLTFKPEFRGIAAIEFYIFNTWGELIYFTESMENIGWDGTLNGTPVPNGNYVYRAVFTTRAGTKIERAGVFVLIK